MEGKKKKKGKPGSDWEWIKRAKKPRVKCGTIWMSKITARDWNTSNVFKTTSTQ